MSEKYNQTWNEFKEELRGYHQQSRDRRRNLLFRGLGNSTWELETTLDRELGPFDLDSFRADIYQYVLDEFKAEAIRHGISPDLPDGEVLDCLARHHGVPSNLLDWTHSPYIAAYFAYKQYLSLCDICPKPEWISIYVLDRSKWPPKTVLPDDQLSIIEDIDLLRFNTRAGRQRGIFLQVSTIQKKVETLLQPALFKYNIPASEAEVVLDELDELMVNATTLMYDLDGAAETAKTRAQIARSEYYGF